MTTTTTRATQPAMDLADRWYALANDTVESWSSLLRPRTRQRPDPRLPGDERDCRCRCCVGDADVVVEARVGERRVVPLSIENTTRRPMEVSLELSSFAGQLRDGGAQVEGVVWPQERIPLGACAAANAVLTLEVAVDGASKRPAERDVVGCEVLYGDLRLVGCDRRPLRIAVVVKPLDCGAVVLDCRGPCC